MIQMVYSLHDALAGAFPLVLLLMGTLLHTFAPHHRLLLEERVKDHQITEAEARRQIAFVRWSAPAMMTLGIVLTLTLIVDIFL